ncbi:MAG: hypothetical protein WBW12_01195 [Terriglobales bacterium]
MLHLPFSSTASCACADLPELVGSQAALGLHFQIGQRGNFQIPVGLRHISVERHRIGSGHERLFDQEIVKIAASGPFRMSTRERSTTELQIDGQLGLGVLAVFAQPESDVCGSGCDSFQAEQFDGRFTTVECGTVGRRHIVCPLCFYPTTEF